MNQQTQPSATTSLSPFQGLRRTLLFSFVLLSLITVVLTTLVNSLISIRTSQNLVLNELIANAELNEQTINNWLTERQQDLESLILNPTNFIYTQQLINGNQVNQQQFLAHIQFQLFPTGLFDELFLIDEAGQVIFSTETDNIGRNHRHQQHFQEGQTSPFISKTFFNVDTGNHEIILTIPLLNADQETIGLFAGRLSVLNMTQYVLARADTTQTGETYLVSRDRQFITKLRFQPQSQLATSEGIDITLADNGTLNHAGNYQNYNDVAVVGAYRWLPDLQVVLVAERAESEALANVQQLLLTNTIIALIIIALSLLIALIITNQIIHPITQLTDAATAIAEGNLNHIIPITDHNEIGILAQAFNAMTMRLRDLIATLEQRVEARTAELAEARDAAQAANQAKSTFLANMSHELRTPLNAIINFSYLLDLGDNLTEDQRDFTSRIHRAGKHLLNLINEILDLAKIEANQLTLDYEKVSLPYLIHDAISITSGLINDKPVTIQPHIPDDFPPVRADRIRLRQVLLNLLSNAAKFTDEGHISIDAQQNDEWVTISVTDTGVGIAPDDLPKVFETFVQVGDVMTHKAQGTGLGLPISKQIVELHGGKLWVESEFGQGTTFFFTLPSSPPPTNNEKTQT
ncbi:MAG TPA: sensor histidine kinase [Anaerolineae bacterium]|nr:sensor histidine kinase [Anaerolineae bacterium]